MKHFTPHALAFGLTLAASTSLAFAQTFPDHPVKVIVPTAPGGSIDTTARAVAERMQAKWGKPVVIENRPGASMRLGAEAVQKSPAGTPKEAAATIETAIKEAVVLPEFRARIEATGAVVRSGSADELRKLLAGDVAKWAKLVKDNNIKLAP